MKATELNNLCQTVADNNKKLVKSWLVDGKLLSRNELALKVVQQSNYQVSVQAATAGLNAMKEALLLTVK